MCKEKFDVLGLDTQRTAYEVEQFLDGHPNITDATADVLSGTVIIEWNESEMTEDAVLDYIEHAGCKPEDRASGVFDRIRSGDGLLW